MEPNTTIYLRGPLSAPNMRALHVHRQLSVRKIAAELDVSTNTIYRALAHHNIDVEEYPFENHRPHLKDLLTKDALTDATASEGLTVAQIAARYDCSVQTVYAYLERHGIDRPDRSARTHKPTSLNVDSVRELYYDQELSIRATASKIGVSNKALRDFMDRNGLKRRTQQHELSTAALVEAYEAGATLQDLATQHDCSVWTITNRLDQAGITRRPAKRRPAA